MSTDRSFRPHRRAAPSGVVPAGVSAAAVACALFAGIAAADDTEVYFGQTNPDANVKPNVLFILDTSGSMRSTDKGDTTRLDRMKVAVKDMLRQADDLNVGLMSFHHEKGGPVLFPVTGLDEEICEGSLCGGVVARSSIVSDLDDVEEYIDPPNDSGRKKHEVATDGNVLELIHDKNTGEETIGLRFTDLQVPRGAQIVEAHLELTARSSDSGDSVHLDIQAEQVGDADTFSDEKKAVSKRSWSIDKTLWTLGDWTQGETYESADISRLVGAVTSRADWCGGNALALRISRNALLASTKDFRRAMTFHHVSNLDASQSGRVPTLRVKYKADNLPANGGCMRTSLARKLSSGSRDAEEYLDNNNVLVGGSFLDMPSQGGRRQEIGLRFDAVDIPKNATIRSAWIELTSQRLTSGGGAAAVSVRVHGERKNNPGPFRSSGRNISNRSHTSASALWEDVPNVGGGTVVRTADLSGIVSELVRRGGWQSGNRMVFLFEHANGSGTRSFKSYENDSNAAARLVVEYDDIAGSVAGGLTARTDTARDRMISIVDSLVADGRTPLVDALWEASLYYRGQPVDYGKTRGPWTRSHRRVSHPRSYAGGTVDRPSGCHDDNLNASQCQNEKIVGDPVYVSPMENSCQTNHIVLLSDGQAVGNDAAARIRALTGTQQCANTGNSSEACGIELAGWLNERDHAPDIRNRQNIKTHTIAFNLKDPDFLRELATAGGGSLYTASNSSDLLGAFRSIIDGVNSIDTSFTAPGATVNQFNRLTHRSDIYFAMFKPSDRPRWSGNLKKFRIGKKKTDVAGVVEGEVEIRDRNDEPAVDEESGFFADSAYSFWPELDDAGQPETTPDGHDVRRGGAANQMALDGLSLIGARRTYTWIGDADDVPESGVDLIASSQKLHESNQDITADILGVGATGDDATAREAARVNLLRWARGVDVDNEDGDDSSEDTRHHMGDPMHSRPVIVNYAKPGVTPTLDDDGEESYDEDDVRSIAFVATNEGYLHAIDTSNGQEQFAFMPKELLGNLDVQYKNLAQDSHPYGLDGPLSVWRDDRSGNKHIVDPGDKAYLFIGMRRGGSNYYALDVSNLNAPRLAWAIEGGENPTTGFDQLGQSWSRMTPVAMTINGTREDVLLFGAGYDTEQDLAQTSVGSPPQKGRGLYIVRASDGTLLWSGLGETGGHQRFEDMKYPMPGNVRAIDINRNGLVDQIYAADTGGQVWRFDVDETHSSQSDNLMKGGVIADFSGSADDSKRRFYNEPDVALIEQDGQRFLTVSVGSGWRAHPLDKVVEDRFYVVRQDVATAPPENSGYGLAKSGGGYRPITDDDLAAVGSSLDPSVNEYGWYLDLKRSGEKILGTSVTFDNSVIFSSYVPQASVNDCSTGIGGGRAYVLDVVTGAPTSDLDQDNDVDGEDESIALKHGGLPPDAMIMITEDSGDEPEILFGPEQLEGAVRNSTRRTFWSDRGEPDEIVQASAEEDQDGDEEADTED